MAYFVESGTMSGAILTADGAENTLSITATPGTPAGSTLTEKAYAALPNGGAAVLTEWSASSGQGLVLSFYDRDGNLTASDDVVSSMSVQGANLIALAGGGVAVDWSTATNPTVESGFDVYSATGAKLGFANSNAGASAPTGFALPDGDFQLTWNGATQVYTAAGSPNGESPLTAPAVFAQAGGAAYLEMQDNQLLFYDGSQFLPGQSLPGEAAHAVTSSALAALTGGNIAATWTDGQAAYVAVYNTTSHTLSAPTLIDWGASGNAHVVALPDGGFAVSWTEGGQQKGEAFGANGELGPSLYLDGSVVGVNSSGELVSLNQTAGSAAEQHYALSYAPPPTSQPQYYNYLGQLMPMSAGNFDDITHSIHGPWQGGATIYAPVPGPAGVAANGGNNTIIASNGDNTFYLGPTDHVVVPDGETGTKTIWAWNSVVMPAGVNNLYFFGAQNYGIGNAGDNLIVMGGNDVNYMDGGAGNDVLVGGLGRNTFGVDAGNGSDVIYNFHTWLDSVRFTGTSFTSFAQVKSAMTQVGDDVVLQIDPSETLTFRWTHVADFTASDFLLPLDTSQLGGLTFDDEFNSLQLLNTTDGSGQWRPNFGADPTSIDDYAITANQEKQLYTAPGFAGQGGRDLSAYNPFSIDNGQLDITAQKFSYLDSQYTWGQAYASGMLNTKGLFMQQYGYFEMKAELPTDLGSWPAFWLAQDPFDPGTEADVLEHLGNDPNVIYARSNDNGWVNGQTTYLPNPSGFHTYGMLWTPTLTTFYIDGIGVMQLPTPASWDKPMYMMLNLALGGWGGTIDESGLPAQMKVDYVRVYGLADGSSVVDNMTSANGFVEISDASYTAAAGVTTVELVGSHQTITANDAGDTLISNATGNVLIGGAGPDIIEIGRGGDTATGNGGADTFVFTETPWAPATITDFHSGHDRIDLTGLLHQLNYSGSDPIGDGYIRIFDNGSGQAQIYSDLEKVSPGAGWYLAGVLTGVSTASLHAGDIVFGGGSVPLGGAGGSTGGGDTGGGSTGGGGTGGGSTAVLTSDASYTAPGGVTDITLTGSQQSVTGNDSGDTFHSNNTGNRLIGGAGADVFDLGRAGDVATGGGGADTFAFAQTPWSGAHITDFGASDKVDLTGILAQAGYSGSDPVGAGYIKITDDGAGDAQIWSSLSGSWWLVTTLDHVTPAAVQVQGDFVLPVVSPPSGGTAASTNDASYTTPAGVTDITLTGSRQTVTGNDAGDAFHSDNNTGNVLIGGAGSDLFDIGRAGDVVTGGGGADTFAFAETPWTGATITDFNLAQDRLDLTVLLARSHYMGSGAVADGYLKIVDDGAGDAQVWSDLDKVAPGAGWVLVATLDHVSATSLHLSGAFITG